MNNSVLVTGSSRGIGRAIALEIAQAGYSVVIHYRKERSQAEELQKHIASIGGNARLLQFDVTDRDQCKQILETDIETHGAYYGVVCNAGIIRDGAFPALSGEDWDSVIHTNLDAFYNVLHPLIMPMVRRRKPGRIVTLASVSGLMGNRGQTNYSASKAGIIAASKSLALELAKREITVNCVAPGLIETEMTDDILSKEVMNMIPARRAGKASEVASLVKYLLSPEAAYITRQVISVNGGMC
ncbi:3-oxoacyl-[acyl-carrier-protein] reductase FabG [Zhongshania aliphaticivorans]|uniref:3-oxoacyl-[acyl-carrier-protein] reductase FabG n=1 Tax=Zhongshania aliphaticivorans TaxID=1470434 RepID=A0A5S9NMQ0_9GAMM|nr:3-oxoacyl-ACP reductase FabG [Zhongshania aliphaticivorans]CAA0091644.1 3-oxoacyl-[acyl-carrier-protein] reductase FabG [Zhongshania aliphaticivorans]CAA0098995.1 3-oxoacyl-[acyl-carrier-protein] reductase FabG [Zhongshania aliphaticivorans]